MSNTNFFGWNLLYSSVSADIKSNQDVIVCLTHYVLISNSFECIGIGDSKNMDGNEPKTEGLPAGWNDAYQLRYVHQGRLYLLQGTALDDGIMLNLIRPDERTTAMIQLNTRIVLRRTGSIDEMIPNNKEVVKQIKTQLIEKVTVSAKSRDSGSQTTSTAVETPPSSMPRADFTEPSRSYPQLYPDPLLVGGGNMGGLGRHDLDPLGGLGPRLGGFPGFPAPGGGFNPLGSGGGGMLFQPPSRPDQPRPGGMPPGAVPPGARFDPFRPPDIDRPPRGGPPRPDNDEMPPPGFDDMYM